MKWKPLLVASLATALAAGSMVAAPQASAAEPVSVLELLLPHALGDRVAPDGTPIAVQLPGSERVIGARPSTTPAAVDLATTPAGTRYFVDCQATAGGTGLTVASPLNTLAAASAVTLEPGDELLFKRGTVCEGQLKPKGSGEPGKRISIDAYGDAAAMPRLDGKGVESVVRLDNQEHWQIRNLEITNVTNDSRDYTTPRRGIVVALTDFGRGQDYEISDNYIHHVWGQNRKDLGGSGGIQFEAYSSVPPSGRYAPCNLPCRPTAFDGIHVHHNTVENVNRSGINVGSNFRSRESVGGSIQDYTFFEWGPMHTHDNIVSNVGGDAIVVQFASKSKVENNTVWDSSNFHGGKSNNGNNAAVWAWDADYVEFRNNHVFKTVMPNGTWDGTAFDADYGTTGTLFEYNLTHQNEGGFMLFCGCGGLSTQTVMRYNISLADGAGAEDHNEGPRLFFQAGQTDAEVYNNTFLLQPNVHLNKGASGGTAVVFANNSFLAQGDVIHAAGSTLAEVWRNNLFAGTWSTWPRDGEGNQMAAGLTLRDGAGIDRLMVDTRSVIARGAPIAEVGTVDVLGNPVPHALPPDVGAFQLTDFPAGADVTVVDGGFENATSAWTGGTKVTTGARSGSGALSLAGGTAEQTVRAAVNRTYRLTAAVKGDVDVTVTHPSGAVATASKTAAAEANGYTPVSTVLRTASTANTLEVTLSGTGTVDDVALTEIVDYVVDGSFESPGNHPWNNGSRSRDAVSGQSALGLAGALQGQNPRVVVPEVGTYEVWGWAKSPAGAVSVGARGAGGTEKAATIDSRSYAQASTTFTPVNTVWGTPQAEFTVFCSVATAAEGVVCDDLSVTELWDGTAPAVTAAPVFTPPTAPADPPAPPRPAQPAWVPFSDVTVVGASSAHTTDPASNVNDADTSSIWHTAWSGSKPAPPHWVTLQVEEGYTLESLQYVPRQDGNLNGRAKDYTIYASDSNDDWAGATVLAEGTLPSVGTPSEIEFDEPTTLRYIRFQIDSAYIKADDPHQYGSAATIRLGYVQEAAEPPVVTPLTVNVVAGSPVSIQVTASSEAGPLTYAADGLPAGLTIDEATGLITGTPTETGTFTGTITATDADGVGGTASFQMVVAPAPVEDTTDPVIGAIPAQTGTVGEAISPVTVTATDESTPLTYALSGAPGLTINPATGVISGTPTEAGTHTGTVTVTDAAGNSSTRTFTFTVAPAPVEDTTGPVIGAIAPLTGTVGEAIAPVTVTATDESTPLTYALTGVPGLTINPATGVISGTPTKAGTHTGTVTVTDTAGNSSTSTIQVTVKAKPTPPPPTPGKPTFVRSVPYTKPGFHNHNGRRWHTTCEVYSQTERCRTEIWATVVDLDNGKFVRKTGWAFNNLTYLPFMERQAWANNPLGFTNRWIGTDGAQWRTECDTALTGGNACRSFRMTTVYDATPKAGGGYTFSQENKWVFNNIVMFGNYAR